MSKRVSIVDIAREANVSPMTVSRVIRNKDEVSAKTRDKVTKIIERLGYRPNALARGLVTQRTGTIGLVIPDVANPFFSEIALAVETQAYKANHNVFLCNSGENVKRELEILRLLQDKQVDGVILSSSRASDDDLREAIAGFSAVVLTNRQLEDSHSSSAVLVNDFKGGYDLGRHLIKEGHENIAYLFGPLTSRGGLQRAKGFYQALEEAELEPNPSWEVSCSPNTQGGFSAAHALLSEHPKITALFCYNDLVAVGALQACAALKCRVPEDIAVTGFDDIPLAALVTPALTTCCVPRAELGSRAAEFLLGKLEHPESQPEETLLQPELVVRVSA